MIFWVDPWILSVINKELHVICGQFWMNNPCQFSKTPKLPSQFRHVLKSSLDYLSQIALKSMQLLVQIIRHLRGGGGGVKLDLGRRDSFQNN